jgi:hypothetical protein
MNKRKIISNALGIILLAALLLSNMQPASGTSQTQDIGTEPFPENIIEANPVTPVYSISGKVTDQTGLPLEGVTIADDQGHAALSDESGEYALTGLIPGKYIITPNLTGVTLLPYYRVIKVVDTNVEGVNFYIGTPYSSVDTSGSRINSPEIAVNVAQPPSTDNFDPSRFWETTPGDIPPEADLTAQSAFSLGAPGLSFRHVATYGTTEEPYLVDNNHIFGANGIAVDGSDNLLLVEERGKRFQMYDKDGNHLLTIGQAGMGYNSENNFDWPYDTTRDSDGNIWVTDVHRVIKYDSTGNFILQYPPENSWEAGSDELHFNQPYGIALGDGMLFVADRMNHRVQVFALLGGQPVYLRTIGQTGNPGGGNDQFNEPYRLTYYDHALYVADLVNHRIQKCIFNVTGFDCSTFLGVSGEPGSDFNHLAFPTGIAFGVSKLYVSDGGNFRALECDLNGSNCTHFAGTAGEQGKDDSHFYYPSDVDVDSSGNVYVADPDSRIQIFDSTGNLIATRGTSGVPYLTDGNHFNTPSGVAVDPDDGSIYILEDLGFRLVKLNSSGVQQWAVGEAGWYGNDDQHLGNWWTGSSGNLGIDSLGRIYVPDTGNYRVQIYLPDGSLWGTLGDDWGNDNAHFAGPAGIAIGPNDDIFVADRFNHRVQVYDTNLNHKATLGETGVAGYDNSHFNEPWGVAIDHAGNIYVADANNYRVQKCRLDGNGGGTCIPFAGVTGVSGRDFPYLTHVNSVTVDQNGLVYIADDWEARIQVFDPDGAYRTTIGGAWGANSGQLRNPMSLAVDTDGNVYVADRLNQRIQKYSPGVPNWDQMNINGFGEIWNERFHSLEVFNNQIYAGTGNSTNGTSIWRSSDGIQWDRISDYGFGNLTSYPFSMDSIVFNGKIYFDAGWGGNPAQIWRYDGSNWEQITDNGFGDPGNNAISVFGMFDSQLYAAFANDNGLQIWRSSSGDADSWSEIYSAGAGSDATILQAMGLADFNSNLYASVINMDGGIEVWQYTGSAWTQVNTDNFGDANNTYTVSGLGVFGSYLYIGTYNQVSGGQVWRMSTGNVWTEVVSDGFGDANNIKVNGFYTALDGYLYAQTVNFTSGVELWRTNSGADGTWSQVNLDGFGDSNNSNSQWSNGMTSFNGRLFIGTINYGNGGEIWAGKPMTFSISGTISNVLSGDVVTLNLYRAGSVITSQTVTGTGSPLPYSFSNLGNGSYRILPSNGGYTFTPLMREVSINEASMTGQDFSASTRGVVILVAPLDGARPGEYPVNLDWQDAPVTGSKYQLQVSLSPTFSSTFKNLSGLTASSFIITGTANNTLYYWRVRTYTGSTPSGSWSAVWQFTTPNPPGVPTLTVPAANSMVNTLSPFFRWSAPSGTVGASYYRLQISPLSTFSTLDVDEYIYGGMTWFYLNQSLNFNRVYYWRVRAYAANSHAGAWTAGRKFITRPEQPWLDEPCDYCTPETLRPTFRWNDNTNTGTYQISLSTFGTTLLTKEVTGKAYTLTTSLIPGTRYWWRVRGKGLGGYGPWSEVWTFYAPYPPAIPTLVAPAANAVISGIGDAQWYPTLSWNSVTGTRFYRIQLANANTFAEGSIIYTNETDTISFNGWAERLEPNTAHFWRVQACNDMYQCSIYTTARKFFTRPGKPLLLTPTDGSHQPTAGFFTSWGDALDPEQWLNSNSFTIQFSKSASFATIAKSATVTVRTYKAVLTAGTYYWRVRANGIGGSSGYGDWSDAWQVITP